MRQLEEMTDAAGQCLCVQQWRAAFPMQASFLLEAASERCADIFSKSRALPQDLAKLITSDLAGNDRRQRDDAAGFFRADQETTLAEEITRR